MPDFQVLHHRYPIGFCDALIDVLAPRAKASFGKRLVEDSLYNLPPDTALVVLDMQTGFDDPYWGPRNNPAAESNVAALLGCWRRAKAPVIHVHHDSPDEHSPLRRGRPGNAPKRETQPLEGESVYRKAFNSAFIGTSLDEDLRAMHVGTLVIVGMTTNHCVSTTARMAGNLGYVTFVGADATATFDRHNLDGTVRRAADVHEAALSDLHNEFAQVVTSAWLIEALGNISIEETSHD